jgi:hypothetical protein
MEGMRASLSCPSGNELVVKGCTAHADNLGCGPHLALELRQTGGKVGEGLEGWGGDRVHSDGPMMYVKWNR